MNKKSVRNRLLNKKKRDNRTKNKSKEINKKLLLWIIIPGILLIVGFIFWFGFKEMIFEGQGFINSVRANEITIDTNENCIVRYDYNQSCVWSGYVNVPENSDNISFYISLSAYPNQNSNNRYSVDIYNPQTQSFENIFSMDISESIQSNGDARGFTVMSQGPGAEITPSGYHGENGDSYWACNDEFNDEKMLIRCKERYGDSISDNNCKCVYYPNCFEYTEEGQTRKYCVMPDFFFGGEYLTDEVRFNTKMESIGGANDMTPIANSAIAINGIEFGTIVQEQNDTNQTENKTTYYRFFSSSNSCSPVSIYENDKTSNDYLTLQLCQVNIVENNETGNNGSDNESNGVDQIGDYYRFEDNKCSFIELLDSKVTLDDYEHLATCRAKIEIGSGEDICNYITCETGLECIEGECDGEGINWLLWGTIGGVLLIIFVVIMIIVFSRKKNNGKGKKV